MNYTGRFKTAAPDRYDILREYAKENRRNQTYAEALLWEELRGDRIGHKFYRQHIIGDYIVDFLCHDDGLIIEVNGAYHAEKTQEESDEARTNRLESFGFRVIRFTNEEVVENIEEVLERINKVLK